METQPDGLIGDPLVWVLALCIYLIAGLVKGVFGIGLPTLGIGLLAQFIAPRTAIALAVLPMVVLNAWQLWRSGLSRELLVRFWRLGLALGLVILLVSALAAQWPERTITLALGVVIVLFAAGSLWRQLPRLPDALDSPAQWIVGVVSGIFGGLAGLWAPLIVLYMSARRVSKEAFVQAMGLLLFIGSTLLLIGYWHSGVINAQILKSSSTLLPSALIGFSLGELIRRRLSAERFHRALLVFFLLMGLNLLRRGWFA